MNHYAVLLTFAALPPLGVRPEIAWLGVGTVVTIVALCMMLLVERPLAAIRDRVRGHSILPEAKRPAVELPPLERKAA